MHDIVLVQLAETDHELGDQQSGLLLWEASVFDLGGCLEQHGPADELHDEVESAFAHVEIVQLAVRPVLLLKHHLVFEVDSCDRSRVYDLVLLYRFYRIILIRFYGVLRQVYGVVFAVAKFVAHTEITQL